MIRISGLVAGMRVKKIKTSENLKVVYEGGVSEANKMGEGRIAPVASPLQLFFFFFGGGL